MATKKAIIESLRTCEKDGSCVNCYCSNIVYPDCIKTLIKDTLQLVESQEGIITVYNKVIPQTTTIKAKWYHLGGDEWYCSNCDSIIHTEGSWETPKEKYCSNCGAEMKDCYND